MNFDPTNIAIAIFTAIAAVAAWRAASIAKSTAEATGKTAEEQTKVSVTAAKANALASRINIYSEQIAIFDNRIQDAKVRGMAPMQMAVLTNELDRLMRERNHLVAWLELQTDALGVGLGNPCAGSDYLAPRQN
jgi:hypothetical protein